MNIKKRGKKERQVRRARKTNIKAQRAKPSTSIRVIDALIREGSKRKLFIYLLWFNLLCDPMVDTVVSYHIEGVCVTCRRKPFFSDIQEMEV